MTSQDSAGVTILVNPGDDVPFADKLDEIWSRGGIDDEEVALIRAHPGHIVSLENGDVAFIDIPNMVVRTLDAATGQSRLTWGGRGSGPGELLNPDAIARLAGDTIAVYDRGRGRIIRWTSTGELIDELPIQQFPTGGQLRPASGGFIFNTHRSTVREESLQNLLVLQGDSATSIRTFTTLPYTTGQYPSCPRYGVASPPLFSTILVWDARDGIVAISDSEEYVIDVISEAGRKIRSIRRNIQPAALTEAAAAERVGEDFVIPPLGCTIPALEVVRARGFSDHLPVVGGLTIAGDGSIWVQRNSLESPPYLIDVFTMEGEYRGTMPPGTPFPATISETDAVVIDVDSQGVPIITRYMRR